MHGVYFHSSAALTSFMNMKSRDPDSSLSSDGKSFAERSAWLHKPLLMLEQLFTSAGLLQRLGFAHTNRGLPALMGGKGKQALQQLSG